ncbi:MAG: hypothetical protein HY286_04800 [Planctomycetes bacterium]|nr:hypothetical protein [Planctomycetota bacterium]
MLQKRIAAIRCSPFLYLLFMGACAAKHPLEREVDFDRAMQFEVFESSYQIDGEPVDAANLGTVVARAHEKHGGGDRIPAVILLRLAQGADEKIDAYKKRRAHVLDAAIDALRMAGVKDIRIGPPSTRPTAEQLK